MARSIRGTWLMLALSASPAHAQSKPTPGPWMPLEVGAFWDYDTSLGRRVTIRCVDRVREDGRDEYVVERTNWDFATVERWCVRDNRLWKWPEPGLHGPGAADARVCVLELPPGISAYWRWNDEQRAELESPAETVTVPAGTFRCSRIRHGDSRFWIAQGVGIVKFVEDGPTLRGAPITLVLSVYGRGGKPPEQRLLELAQRYVQRDARGAPVRFEAVRGREFDTLLGSRFCRVWWKDSSLLLRERRGKVTAFDPRDPAHWNALLQEEGLVLDTPERTARGDWVLPRTQKGFSTLARVASSVAELVANEACKPGASITDAPAPADGGEIGLDGVMMVGRRVTGTSLRGVRYQRDIEVTARGGKIVGVDVQ